MDREWRDLASIVMLWLGRATALGLFCFWGLFFVEHLNEWFIAPKGAWPPPFVWSFMALHLTMMIGLVTMIGWERVGALLTIAATAAFFGLLGLMGPGRYWWLAFVNAPPIVMILLARWMRTGAGPRGRAAGLVGGR